MSSTGARARTGVALASAIVACVFVASPLHLPLNNPNEGVRVFAAKALVEHHTFAIDDVVREWGYIDDKSAYEGKVYSSKAPLSSILGAAAYAIVHPFTGDLSRPSLTRLCRGAMALVTLAALFVLWRGLRRRVEDPVVADLVVVGVLFSVLATLNVLSGHALAAVAPAAALVLIQEGGRRALAMTGLLLAAAVGAEYPALLAAVPLCVLAVLTAGGLRAGARAFASLCAGAAPVVVVVGVAHTVMFGAPWRTGYGVLENPTYREVVKGTLFGIGAPHMDALGAVAFSPAVGLFFYSPFLLVGLLSVGRMRRSEGTAIAVGVLALCVFIAGFRGWRGGWSVGPRYISEMIGLLAVPAALAFDVVKRRLLARAALASLVAVTLVHAGVAGMFFPHLPELFANPVHEMMLPLVAKGVAPDSLPLLVGASPRAAALVLLAVLASPLVVALASAGRRALAIGAGASALTIALVVVIGARVVVTTAPPAKAALEARRMLDNWRPESGNPLVDEERERTDPRNLTAIDRARTAFPIARAQGCAGPLVVVPDELALHLRVDAPLLMVTASDVTRVKGALPCTGAILVMGDVPRSLQGLREVKRDGRFVWLARPP